MAKRCEVCGKGPVVGRTVSHAHNVGPRRFEPNLQTVKALINGAFPDDLMSLAHAARESVQIYRRYVSLIYVDVVEFDGSHIRRFYAQIADRFQAFLDESPDVQKKLRPDVSPLTAAILVSRLFLYFYSVEYVFGVPNHFGKDEDTVMREIVEILEHGIRPMRA